MDISSKIKETYKLNESNEQDALEKAAKLQSAEIQAKSIVGFVTDDWTDVPGLPGIEMKRSSANVSVNNSVIIKGLGHAWSHGIKVIDENGNPIGGIEDLKSPWGRFVSKFLPEENADINNQEIQDQIVGPEEEFLDPEGIEADSAAREELTLSEIKDVICKSVEYLESFFHRLKLTKDNYKGSPWASKDPVEERGSDFEYDFNHIAKQICSPDENALSKKFRSLKSFTSIKDSVSIKEDYVISPEEALHYAHNYLYFAETVRTSKYLENENAIFKLGEYFSFTDAKNDEDKYVIFKGEDGIQGAAISRQASPLLYDMIRFASEEISNKYQDDRLIRGIPETSKARLSYKFKTLGLQAEKFPRLLSLMTHAARIPNAEAHITNTLLDIANKAGKELIIGLDNITRFSLTDLDTLGNVDLSYQLRDVYGYINRLDQSQLEEFLGSANRGAKVKWTIEQAKHWLKAMLISNVRLNQKSNMLRRPVGVSETGTDAFLGTKSDVIEYYPPGVGETILLNQGVPPEKISEYVKLEQSPGRIGNDHDGTAMDSKEVFGLAEEGYDSVNFSLKSLYSPKEMNIRLGGYKYRTVLEGLNSYLKASGDGDRSTLAVKGIVDSYAQNLSLDDSQMQEIATDAHKRMDDVEKMFKIGLSNLIDKDGNSLESEQKMYVLSLVDELIDMDIFESSVSYRLRSIKYGEGKITERDVGEIAGALLTQKIKYDMFKPNHAKLGIETEEDLLKHRKKTLHTIGLLMHLNGGCAEPTLMQITDVPNNDVYLTDQNSLVHDAIQNLAQLLDQGEDIMYSPKKHTSSGYALEVTKEGKVNIKGPNIGGVSNRPLNYVSLYYKMDHFESNKEVIPSLAFEVETSRRYTASKNFYNEGMMEGKDLTESIYSILRDNETVIDKLLKLVLKEESSR